LRRICALPLPDWIGRGGREGNSWKEGGWDGEVPEKSLAKKPWRLFFVPEGGSAGPSAGHRIAQDEKTSKAGTTGGGWVYNRSVRKAKTEIPDK
jgi:hypothetical protein